MGEPQVATGLLEQPKVVGVMDLICPECKSGPFKHIGGLAHHRSAAHGVRSASWRPKADKIPCPECGKLLSSPLGLRRHITVQHGGRIEKARKAGRARAAAAAGPGSVLRDVAGVIADQSAWLQEVLDGAESLMLAAKDLRLRYFKQRAQIERLRALAKDDDGK